MKRSTSRSPESRKSAASFLTPFSRVAAAVLFSSLAAQAVPPGFVIREFVGNAEEPELYPTAVSAAAGGDVYISSDKNGSLGHLKDMGRILIARDTKNAGRADQMIEFARVDSPRGGHFVGGVFYLIHPPFLSALRDKDGDGKADERTVLVEGLGGGIEHPRGADHTTNGCRMGIDGWIYIAVGDFGAGIESEKEGAKGRDGKRVTLYGGGVMRVRPDGSELEIYSEMTRNICDVAVSPTLDLFSRDNTNDGKGWNTRFHHFTSLANAGYPRLYKNFENEIAKPLADYGGGSGTGGLYLSEPGFPEGYGESLFTCDWTTGAVYRHPIRPFEATFVAEQENFHPLPRATDIDVDGNSRLYMSDWRGGGFSYLGKGKPNGIIQQIVIEGITPNRYVDVTKATDPDLVALLSSKSAVQRLEAQREILARGKKALAEPVLAVARASTHGLYSRVAAVFTYKQLLGKAATPALVELCKDDAVREFALRALADRLSEVEGVPSEPFVAGLRDANPRVRLQALIGLQRLGARKTAPAILEAAATWPADESTLGKNEHFRLPHTAIAALTRLGNEAACLEAVATPAKRHLALSALQGMHTPEAVQGLVALSTQGDQAQRFAVLSALARLYNREKPWNYKDWWSTRPDDRGPYFTPETWDATPQIHAAIEKAYAGLAADQRVGALDLLSKNRIQLSSLKLEGADPLQLALHSRSLQSSDMTLLVEAALAGSRAWEERVECYRTLVRPDSGATLASILQVLGGWSKDASASRAARQAIEDFVNDSKRGSDAGGLRELANRSEDAVAFIAWRALLTAHRSPLSKANVKERIQAEIDKNPREIGFFQAIAHMGLTGFDKAIDAAIGGDNTLLINAAQAAREAGQKAAAQAGKRIAELSLEEATAVGMKGKGDVKLGQKLFTQQGCIACHSIDLAAEQKGPYLGAAGAKFGRDYLVESILQPGKVVAQGFQTVSFAMKDGAQHLGFVTGEADGVITLRNIAGQSSQLKRDAVREEKHLPQSMMPEGLAAGLTAREFASLIEYLLSLKAIGG
jgi:putative heme-binding domain-containing protein